MFGVKMDVYTRQQVFCIYIYIYIYVDGWTSSELLCFSDMYVYVVRLCVDSFVLTYRVIGLSK